MRKAHSNSIFLFSLSVPKILGSLGIWAPIQFPLWFLNYSSSSLEDHQYLRLFKIGFKKLIKQQSLSDETYNALSIWNGGKLSTKLSPTQLILFKSSTKLIMYSLMVLYNQ